jgi:hypothetical protein
MRVDVVVALLAATALSGCEQLYSPASPSRDWATHESAHYVLNVRPASFAEANAGALVEVLEDQFSHTVATLRVSPGARISMFLYNAGSELNPPLPSARAGVAFPETNAVHAVAFAPLDNDLRTLLTHEANHVIIHNGLGRAGTSFMNEGLATALVSEHFGGDGPVVLHRWVRNNRARVPPLADLIDDEKWSSNSQDGYRASGSFLAFLIERYGADRLKLVYHARSAQFADRLRDTYGRSLAELEAEWLTRN